MKNKSESVKMKSISYMIENGKYDEALSILNDSLSTTSCLRTCICLIAKCHIGNGDYLKANEVLLNCYPYNMSDADDMTILQLKAIVTRKLGILLESKRLEKSIEIFKAQAQSGREGVLAEYEVKAPLCENFLVNQSGTALMGIIRDCYALTQFAEVAVFNAYANKLGIKIDEDIQSAITLYTQLNDFTNELVINTENRYCVISNALNRNERMLNECIVFALSKLGKEVVHILYNIGTEEALQSSSRKQEKKAKSIHIAQQNAVVNELEHNMKLLLNSSGTAWLLFADSKLLMQINENLEMTRIIEMNYRHFEEQPIKTTHCVVLGDFYQHASYKWGYDVKKAYNHPCEVDFSIIIPVRNTAEYLCETLSTCLNQDYDGSYEVLISDNSDINNDNVYNVVRNINDAKLRYIRVPYPLSLAKSFEFAYMNAKGRYLLSLGADDGLTRYALVVMKKALDTNPNSSIVQVNRAAYAWPSYTLRGEAHRFYVLYHIDKQIHQCEIETKLQIRQYAMSDKWLDFLPFLYMHTCIKREYIQKIINVTGKFEYGKSQDVYTGILNLLIEPKYVYVNIPVVIAADSLASFGFNYSQLAKTFDQYKKKRANYYANYRYENYFFEIFRKRFLLFVDYGCYSLTYLEFLKANHFFADVQDYEQNDDLLKILTKILYAMPESETDKPYVYASLERIAKNDSETTYNGYIKNLHKLNHPVKRLKKAITKHKRIASLILYVKNKMVTLKRKIHGCNQTVDLRINETNYERFDCKELNITGIKTAAEYIANHYRNDVIEYCQYDIDSNGDTNY